MTLFLIERATEMVSMIKSEEEEKKVSRYGNVGIQKI